MRLDVEGIIPIGEEIFVSFLGETKSIDSIDTHVSFNILKYTKDTPELIIYNKPTKSNYTFWYIVLYLFTFPFHILGLLIRDGIKEEWYKDLRTYNTKIIIPININRDTSISFKLSQPQFTRRFESWYPPKLKIDTDLDYVVEYTKNPQVILNEYAILVKGIVGMIGCFNGLILVILININQWTSPGSISFMLLFIAILILLFVVLRIHYNRATILINNLLNLNASEQDINNTKCAESS